MLRISSSVVVFPQPDSPTKAKLRPSRSVRSTPSTANTEPTRRRNTEPFMSGKVFLRLRTSRATTSLSDCDTTCCLPSTNNLPDDCNPAISLCRVQAIMRVGDSDTRSGIFSSHCGAAAGQRGANAQPAGSATGDGGTPSIDVSRLEPTASTRGIERSRPMVYGIAGDAYTSSTLPSSTTLPAYIMATRSARPATTPRSCVTRTTAAPVMSRAVLSTSRICACTVTSSAVVGSSAKITLGWLAIASAIITR